MFFNYNKETDMLEIFENGATKSVSPEVMLPKIVDNLFRVYGKSMQIILKRGWGIDINKPAQICKDSVLFNQLYHLSKSEIDHFRKKKEYILVEIKKTGRSSQPLADYVSADQRVN